MAVFSMTRFLATKDEAVPLQLKGRMGRRRKTSLRKAYGSCLFILADWIRLITAVARCLASDFRRFIPFSACHDVMSLPLAEQMFIAVIAVTV